MGYRKGALFAVTLSLLLCASFFIFSIYQSPKEAFSVIKVLGKIPNYLSTDQYCPVYPDLNLTSGPAGGKNSTIDTDMAKLLALNQQFQEVKQRWDVISSTLNAARDTKKIGTQIRVSWEGVPSLTSLAALPAQPAQGIGSSDPNLPCLGVRSYELIKGLPDDDSRVLLRNVTERIPLTSFDNETGSILEKLSPDTRAELMRVAIESDANSPITQAIIHNYSKGITENQSELLDPTVATGEDYAIQFVSTVNDDCQAPPSLSSNARTDICTNLDSDERTTIVKQVTNTKNTNEAGRFALDANRFFYNMEKIINIAKENMTFLNSVNERNELDLFRSVMDKPTPQNLVMFLTKTQTTTSIEFIRMFYPPQDGLKPIFLYVVEDEGDQIAKRISQDKELASAINNIFET